MFNNRILRYKIKMTSNYTPTTLLHSHTHFSNSKYRLIITMLLCRRFFLKIKSFVEVYDTLKRISLKTPVTV